VGDDVGTRFAEALSRKDFEAAKDCVDPELDFRALTPNRSWQTSTADELVTEVLEKWLEPEDEVEGLIDVEIGTFADRKQIAYSWRGSNPKGPFVVEQVAYYETGDDGRIKWLRILCSGMRPPPA
jgi:hypothetical protein